jgi:hypothetical protein
MIFPVSGEIEVKIGQLLQGVVGRIDKLRQVVDLNCDPYTVSKCVVCPCLTWNCHFDFAFSAAVSF